jgi:hypothetical protein
MMMYAFIGGGAGVNAASTGLATTALGNGLCLAVLIYSTAGVSGGHRTYPDPATCIGCCITSYLNVAYCCYQSSAVPHCKETPPVFWRIKMSAQLKKTK